MAITLVWRSWKSSEFLENRQKMSSSLNDIKLWTLSSRVNVSVFQSLLSMTWFWLFLFSVIGVLFFTILERIGFLKQANRYDICICGRTTRGFLPSQHLASLHHSYTLLWKHKAVSLRLARTWPHESKPTHYELSLLISCDRIMLWICGLFQFA